MRNREQSVFSRAFLLTLCAIKKTPVALNADLSMVASLNCSGGDLQHVFFVGQCRLVREGPA
jgi:hypothetical protein